LGRSSSLQEERLTFIDIARLQVGAKGLFEMRIKFCSFHIGSKCKSDIITSWAASLNNCEGKGRVHDASIYGAIMVWKQQSFERQSLYEAVWKDPITKLAKQYSISDVGLRKICVTLEIPIPPRGYWAKLAHGKATQRPLLPPSEVKPTGNPPIFRAR
jgi:hypothetical protein